METTMETYQGIEVAEAAWIRPLRSSKYGSVPGLEDEELADPDELERQVMREEWGPVLLLPRPKRAAGFRPEIDEDGYVFGAFGSVDFERRRPELDRARYKAEKLQEECKHVMLLHETVRRRLPAGPAGPAGLVIKYLRMGVIELEHVSDGDMVSLWRLHLRARRLREEISRLREISERRRQARARAWLEAVG